MLKARFEGNNIVISSSRDIRNAEVIVTSASGVNALTWKGECINAWGVLFNRLLVLSINSSFARSRGIPAFWTESIFASLLAVIVSVSIQWVGLLIINALLVLPGATARNVAANVKQYVQIVKDKALLR